MLRLTFLLSRTPLRPKKVGSNRKRSRAIVNYSVKRVMKVEGGSGHPFTFLLLVKAVVCKLHVVYLWQNQCLISKLVYKEIFYALTYSTMKSNKPPVVLVSARVGEVKSGENVVQWKFVVVALGYSDESASSAVEMLGLEVVQLLVNRGGGINHHNSIEKVLQYSLLKALPHHRK
ncbi:hypothetical protein K435DRAFT_935157 [Dendrothele bispora CBS 962.96]|uniref:Uncharacterized protein n=1 Tax=Dendrothele bispora (strain CBS 962.96) TaxID=1314807 RepID=A0A4S8L0L5_DENBC|nr:hypothetical protein K435DRAFT_935157 [Dendrothele bispora CBS 962.96]